MPTILDAADAAAVLKELYPEDTVREIVYKSAPLFALIPKDEEAGGEIVKVPLIYGDPQGRSATFTEARANMDPSKTAAFKLTWAHDYSAAQIAGDVIDQSRTDRMAFLRALRMEIDGSLRQLKRSAVHALFRNGGGAIGQVVSGGATATVTLATPEDIVFFEVGQTLTSSLADGTSGTVKVGDNKVISVDESAGTVTFAVTFTGDDDDYLFVKGDFGIKMSGLDAWIPSAAPGAGDSFFQVDRSVMPQRLAGVRYDGSAQDIEDALIDGVEHVVRAGGEPDLIVAHTSQVAAISKALGDRRRYGMKEVLDGRIGFRTLYLDAPSGSMEIIGDLNCQVDVAWCLQMDTWTLFSMGMIPKLLDNDGMPYLRIGTLDGVEVQSVYRAQLGCAAPGWNGRIALP